MVANIISMRTAKDNSAHMSPGMSGSALLVCKRSFDATLMSSLMLFSFIAFDGWDHCISILIQTRAFLTSRNDTFFVPSRRVSFSLVSVFGDILTPYSCMCVGYIHKKIHLLWLLQSAN